MGGRFAIRYLDTAEEIKRLDSQNVEMIDIRAVARSEFAEQKKVNKGLSDDNLAQKMEVDRSVTPTPPEPKRRDRAVSTSLRGIAVQLIIGWWVGGYVRTSGSVCRSVTGCWSM